MNRGSFSGGYCLREADTSAWFRYVPDPGDPLAFTRPDGTRIVLDEEFETDGATTPRFLRFIRWLDPFASWMKSALVHDHLWEIRHREGAMGFFESNAVLHEGCLSLGLAPWKAWLVRRAVDAFGWWVWFRGLKK